MGEHGPGDAAIVRALAGALILGLAACASPAPSPNMTGPSISTVGPTSTAISSAAPATVGASTVVPATPSDPATPASTVEPPSPYSGPGGLDALVDDLAAATGVEVGLVGVVDGRPLTTTQVIVCANHENVRVFEFATDAMRAMAAARIDPDDPSHIGGDIYDWSGMPRFWQRDRVLVLYVGTDEPTIAMLTMLLGEPFSQGRGRPLPRPDTC